MKWNVQIPNTNSIQWKRKNRSSKRQPFIHFLVVCCCLLNKSTGILELHKTGIWLVVTNTFVEYLRTFLFSIYIYNCVSQWVYAVDCSADFKRKMYQKKFQKEMLLSNQKLFVILKSLFWKSVEYGIFETSDWYVNKLKNRKLSRIVFNGFLIWKKNKQTKH